jgi:hypothetical protein
MARTALVLGLAAALAGACASQPTARRTAGQAAAPTYKVGQTGVALSAAARDPATLARVQREQGVGSRRTVAPTASRPAGSVRASQAHGAPTPVRRVVAEPPGRSSTSAAGPAPAFGSAQPPINLQTLTSTAAPSARTERSEAAPAADPALAAASLRTALYVLAALALLGVLALGLAALVARTRDHRQSREGAASVVRVTAANDWSPPVRPATARARVEPPPPRVTILSAAGR